MADLDVVGQGDILNLNTNWMQKQSNDLGEYTNCPGIGRETGEDALLSIPLSEKLDFLSELGDVLGECLDRGHFEVFLRDWAGLAAGRSCRRRADLFSHDMRPFPPPSTKTRFRHSAAFSTELYSSFHF